MQSLKRGERRRKESAEVGRKEIRQSTMRPRCIKKAETGLRRWGARKSTEGEVVDEETEEGMRRRKKKRRGNIEE